MINRKYKIYQLKQDKFADAFLKGSKNIMMKDYDPVYEGITDSSITPLESLNHLFEQFNMNHPSDFKGRSMSVTDMVKIDNTFFYCDSIGWYITHPE